MAITRDPVRRRVSQLAMQIGDDKGRIRAHLDRDELDMAVVARYVTNMAELAYWGPLMSRDPKEIAAAVAERREVAWRDITTDNPHTTDPNASLHWTWRRIGAMRFHDATEPSLWGDDPTTPAAPSARPTDDKD